jgi:hypothetical protein
MANSVGYHEPFEKLDPVTTDLHRALTSLQEELEAVDWYRQRAVACTDVELRTILEHNMREEMEHAAMVLEWIRRREPAFDKHLRTVPFPTGPTTEIEHAHEPDAE